jgi:hypothetical protein
MEREVRITRELVSALPQHGERLGRDAGIRILEDLALHSHALQQLVGVHAQVRTSVHQRAARDRPDSATRGLHAASLKDRVTVALASIVRE